MDTNDDIQLVHHSSIEELQPREIPKALSFIKDTPLPSVPDVSLIFDNRFKPPVRKGSGDFSLVEVPIARNVVDENEPRSVKPTPIAPKPNESYASWRERAMHLQSKENPNTQSEISNFNENHYRFNGCNKNSPVGQHWNEPILKSVDSINECRNHQTSQRGRSGPSSSHLPSVTLNRDQAYGIGLSSREQNYRELENGNFSNSQNQIRTPLSKRMKERKTFTHDAHPFTKGRMRNYANYENNTSDDEDTLIPSLHEPMEHMESDLRSKPYFNKINAHSPRFEETSFERQNVTCNSKRSDIVNKKRDPVRDIYRIVQLQNEQIKSLQSQVEKLIKIHSSEQTRIESPKRRSQCVVSQYVEEGTQTSLAEKMVSVGVEEGTQTSLDEKMVSVGVMTSMIERVDDSCSYDKKAGDSLPQMCKCRNIQEDNTLRGCCISGREKNSGFLPNSKKISTNHQQRDSLSTVMHQIIEEENESSDDSQSCKNILTRNDVNTQTRRSSNHRKTVSDKRCRNVGSLSKQAFAKQTSNQEKRPIEKCLKPSQAYKVDQVVNGDPVVVNGQRYLNKIDSKAEQKLQLHTIANNRNSCSSNSGGLVHNNKTNDEDMTMTLNGVELQTVADPILSPEPSIHVDIQDYHEFSENEQDSSNDDGSYSSGHESMTSGEHIGQSDEETKTKPGENQKTQVREESNGDAKVGWTFYENVLGQVNKLLENQTQEHGVHGSQKLHPKNSGNVVVPTAVQDPSPAAEISNIPSFTNPVATPSNGIPTLEAVREATLAHLRQLGINIPTQQNCNIPGPGNPAYNAEIPCQYKISEERRNVTFDPHIAMQNRDRRPTERSLRINALALKYLSDEQLAGSGHLGLKRDSINQEQHRLQEKPTIGMEHGVVGEVSSSADVTLYGVNGTNLSFTTLRYLQRYQLLPYNGSTPIGIRRHQTEAQQANFADASNAQAQDFANLKPTSPKMEFHGRMQETSSRMSPRGQETRQQLKELSRPEELKSNDIASLKRNSGGEMWLNDNNGVVMQQGTHRHRGGHGPVNRHKKSKSKPTASDQANLDRNRNHRNSSPKLRTEMREVPDQIQTISDVQRNHSSNILDITALRRQPKLL